MEEFRYLKRRSPGIFETFLRYQEIYEERMPVILFDANVSFGPDHEVPVPGETRTASIAAGQMSAGSVPWVWGPNSGLRLGLDG